MYKILLADDEGIVLESMQFIIEKDFPDMCQVETAKSGRRVIELAEQFRPDIAVMDIQMPGINGIDAMREIRATNPNVIFIVMSAYDKFDYAKEAIKLGVLEYIMKPMDRAKITAALKSAMNLVTKERQKRSRELIIKEKMETVSPIIESGLIYNILFHEHFTEDIENYKNILEIKEDYAFMMAVVCGDEQEGNHMTNAVGSSVRTQKYYQEIKSYIKQYYPGCVVGTFMANKIAVMMPCKKDLMDYNTRIEFIDKSRELVRVLRKKTDVSFRIGIGRTMEMSNMSESYAEALNALIYTTGSVAHADDLPIACDYESDYPIDLEKDLFKKVGEGDIEGAITCAKRFFDWMQESYADEIMNIRLKILEFALMAEHMAYENGGMTYKFTSRREYLTDVINMSEFSELKKWFVEKIADAAKNLVNKREEKSNNLIESAVEYIKENYSKNISLDDVSRIVNISPYYFSKLFKEETGEGFVEFLTGIRIRKAKELLAASQLSMKEICSEIGYSDPNYFSRIFKKNVGVSPTEYKEGLS